MLNTDFREVGSAKLIVINETIQTNLLVVVGAVQYSLAFIGLFVDFSILCRQNTR